MKKTLIFSALIMGSMTANAAVQQMDDAAMSEVRGQFNLISGINAGIFSDSVVSGVNAFGARSGATLFNFGGLAGVSAINHWGVSGLTGLNFVGLAGASAINHWGVSGLTGLNFVGLAGASVANTLGGSVISGISLPLGVTGASVLTLPASLNGFGLINAP